MINWNLQSNRSQDYILTVLCNSLLKSVYSCWLHFWEIPFYFNKLNLTSPMSWFHPTQLVPPYPPSWFHPTQLVPPYPAGSTLPSWFHPTQLVPPYPSSWFHPTQLVYSKTLISIKYFFLSLLITKILKLTIWISKVFFFVNVYPALLITKFSVAIFNILAGYLCVLSCWHFCGF